MRRQNNCLAKQNDARAVHMGYVQIFTQSPDKLVFGPQVTKAIVAVRDDNLYLADQPLAKFISTNADAC